MLTEQTKDIHARIAGYDVARALAIFGMVFVNFKLVMTAGGESSWLGALVGALEGRAVATFVVLAGVGISLSTRRACLSRAPVQLARARITIVKRALLLIAVGLTYTPIWPADILHFYGFYFLIGACLLTASDRLLWLTAAFLVTGFLVLLLLFDYEAGWDFASLSYLDLWTLEGMFRHIFFNGFHPVIPWAAFLLVGMWLGRRNILDNRFRRKLTGIALLVWIGAELLSSQLTGNSGFSSLGMTAEDAAALFGTSPMPPAPLYMIAGCAIALLIIGSCVSICKYLNGAPWLNVLSRTGRMSLTIYVLHVVLGMGLLEVMGLLHRQSIEFAVLSALCFNVVSVIVAQLYLSKFTSGPLEWIFRKIAG